MQLNKTLGKALLKGLTLSQQRAFGLLRRWKLGLAWTFEGRVRIDGPVIVRSFGGEVVIADGVMLGPYVSISSARGALLRVGEGTTVNFGTYVEALQSITIGKGCLIGEYCSVRDYDHGFADPDRPIRSQGFVSSPVVIEDDVWLGRSVVVAKGVRIGKGAVIGSNAVVTKNIPAGAVAAGVPARIVKWRKPPTQ